MSNNLGTLTLDLVAETSLFQQGLDRAQRSADRNSREIQRLMHDMDDRIKNTVDRANRNLNLLAQTLAGAVAVSSVRSVIDMADAYGQMSARIKLTIEDISEYDFVQKRLIETANQAQRPLQEIQSIFIDTSGNLRDMGFSLDQAMSIADSFTFALVRNATSAQKAETALRAYDIALNKGRLDGMMWQSVSSAIPSLEVSMSKIFDLPLKRIQQMGFEGKITVDMLNKAFLDSYGDNKAAAESMGSTVSGVFTVMQNNFSELVGELNEITGVTNMISDGLLFAAENMKVVLFPAVIVASAVIGRLTTSAGANALAFIAAQHEAHRYQLALAKMAGVSKGAAIGITAMGTAARGASIAMSVLGGPVGILAIAASGLMLFGNSADKTGLSVESLEAKILGLDKRLSDMSNRQLKREAHSFELDIAQLENDREKLEKELSTTEEMLKVYEERLRLPGYANDRSTLIYIKELEGKQVTLGGKIDDTSDSLNFLHQMLGKVNVALKVVGGSSDTVFSDTSEAFDKMTSKLRDEIGRIGLKSNVAVFEYELNNTDKYDGYTPEQIEELRILNAQKDSRLESFRLSEALTRSSKKKVDIESEYKRIMESTLSDEERRGLELSKNLDILKQYGASEEDMVAVRRAAFESMSVSMPGMGEGGDTLTAQLARIHENMTQLDVWREEQLAKLELAYGNEESALAESLARREEIEQDYRMRRSQFEGEMNQELLNLGINLSNDSLDALRQAGMESSGIYKAMFLANKASAFANAIISANEAEAKANAAYPDPIMGMSVGAMVKGIGLANAGVIAATGLKGMAHSGLDKVPETGTWLLEKGERVVTSNTSAKLDATLESLRSQNAAGGGETVVSNVYITLSGEGDVSSRNEEGGSQLGKLMEAVTVKTMLKELKPGGILARR